jgi:hypothetical protein
MKRTKEILEQSEEREHNKVRRALQHALKERKKDQDDE